MISEQELDDMDETDASRTQCAYCGCELWINELEEYDDSTAHYPPPAWCCKEHRDLYLAEQAAA